MQTPSLSGPRRGAATHAPHFRARRSPRWIAAGVLAMALGGLGGAFLWTDATGTQAVVKVTHPIARGDVIEAKDLVTVHLSRTADIATVPAEQVSDLVGKVAMTDLPKDALLAPGAIGEVVVEKGTVHLGLQLAPGRLPAAGVPSGVPVTLIEVAASSATGATAQEAVADHATFTALVVASPTQGDDGSWLVDVAVSSSDAERIADLAAANRLVLVRQADR